MESRSFCGQANATSELFESKRLVLAGCLLALGLMMLCSAGIGVEKLVLYVAGAMIFLLLFWAILALFNFRVTNAGLGLLTVGLGSVSYFVHKLIKAVKQLIDLVVSIVTFKFVYTYGEVLFPNASLYERVRS